jgi:8-oxo-dGTP diphosphatase
MRWKLAEIKSVGTSILFVNPCNKILLLLRDNIPQIKYPNMWDIPGGNVEINETPEECIIREIKEEFGITITGYELFEEREFPDRTEFTFWQRANFDIQDIELTEGQRLSWFSEQELKTMQLAFDFNVTLNSFFEKKPFNSHS